MYNACYLYRVPIKNIDRFLRITNEAGEIYLRYGATASTMMRITDAAAKYGCLGLSDLLQPTPDEQLFMGIDSFTDVEQFLAKSKQLDADPGIKELFREIQEVIDLEKIIRWESVQAG